MTIIAYKHSDAVGKKICLNDRVVWLNGLKFPDFPFSHTYVIKKITPFRVVIMGPRREKKMVKSSNLIKI